VPGAAFFLFRCQTSAPGSRLDLSSDPRSFGTLPLASRRRPACNILPFAWLGLRRLSRSSPTFTRLLWKVNRLAKSGLREHNDRLVIDSAADRTPSFPIHAANPAISLAPPPNLSDVAWQELQRDRTGTKEVTLNSRITVTRGAVTEVSIKEATNGHTSTEVQRWIRQCWRVCSDIQWHSCAACLFRLIQRTSNQNLARARSQAVEDVFQSASGLTPKSWTLKKCSSAKMERAERNEEEI
jgi:hypothetical protein